MPQFLATRTGTTLPYYMVPYLLWIRLFHTAKKQYKNYKTATVMPNRSLFWIPISASLILFRVKRILLLVCNGFFFQDVVWHPRKAFSINTLFAIYLSMHRVGLRQITSNISWNFEKSLIPETIWCIFRLCMFMIFWGVAGASTGILCLVVDINQLGAMKNIG